MTVKEYLSQAYMLDQRINAHLEEVKRLRDMATGLFSPTLGDKVQTPRDNNAPFVKSVEKIILLENKINAEIDTLVALKEQIHDVISTVEDQNESLILQYRYIQGQSWESIAAAMHADISSAYRWHTNALRHVKMPENPILI